MFFCSVIIIVIIRRYIFILKNSNKSWKRIVHRIKMNAELIKKSNPAFINDHSFPPPT